MQQAEPVTDLEVKLAGFVRTFVRESRDIDSAQAQEALRWVCVGLEFLLGSLLGGCNQWSAWVDGVVPATDLLPDAVQVISGGELRVRGRAVWGEKAEGPFWIEPFLGWVRTSERRDAIVSYELRFADATYGLARFPYGKHLRWQKWFFPTQWLFVFSKGAVGD
jgi:hypothetical protein